MGVTVTVRVGKTYKKFASVKGSISGTVTDGIMTFLKREGSITVVGDGKRESKQITRAANNELLKVAPFMAKSLIGIETGPDDDDSQVFEHAGESLFWRGLGARYKRRKTANKSKHYLHTGTLRGVIAAAGPAILTQTGGVSVEVIPSTQTDRNTGRIHVADIRVTMAPRVGTTLPGLATGRWSDFNPSLGFERKLGFDRSTIAKLRGPTKSESGPKADPRYKASGLGGVLHGRHRPLIQPLVQYWLLFRVPTVIRGAIADRLGSNRIGRRGNGN